MLFTPNFPQLASSDFGGKDFRPQVHPGTRINPFKVFLMSQAWTPTTVVQRLSSGLGNAGDNMNPVSIRSKGFINPHLWRCRLVPTPQSQAGQGSCFPGCCLQSPVTYILCFPIIGHGFGPVKTRGCANELPKQAIQIAWV